MKFADFYSAQKSLMEGPTGGVDYKLGSPASLDTVRTWNAFAQLLPDLCEDVVVLRSPLLADMMTEPNPFRMAASTTPTPPARNASKKEKDAPAATNV